MLKNGLTAAQPKVLLLIFRARLWDAILYFYCVSIINHIFKEVPAHKVILLARSAIFAKIFFHDVANRLVKNDGRIQVKNLKACDKFLI
jgi:arginine exporter protein ArgO